MTTEAGISSQPIEVRLDYTSRINFAFQQNGIPVIRRIEIRNHSGRDLLDVVCRFKTSPEWARDFETRITAIPAQTDYVLSDPPLSLSLDYLAELSDRVRGEMSIDVRGKWDAGADAVEESVSNTSVPVEVYAFDEWTGLKALPEILAAFVTPNIAVAEKLLGRAADLLGDRTPSSALNGYQAKSKKRVYEILEAIFNAVKEQRIRYSNPPASFEDSGQRIRFGEQILSSRLATCLDLCLLFAGLIEQAGLRPLVLLQEGHAYAGCWLVEESLPEPSCDDLQSIRKRVELEEIILFDATLASDGDQGGFEAAEAAAQKHLRQDAIFRDAIDIFRSRASGIRPLPLKREEGSVDLAVAAAAHAPSAETPAAAAREFAPEPEIDGEPATPEGRIDHWRQQLLDLTLRNRLLNFRETKQTIPLACPDPEHLEDELAADKAFRLCPQSQMMAGLDPRSLALRERQLAEDPVLKHLTEELHEKRLRSSLSDTELPRRLTDLYRRVRLEMEESGANTLYLALGFLEWKEARGSDRVFRAPILLIPARLERKSIQQGFFLKRHDEDAVVNVTLLELLKRDFEMEIPGVNPPPEGENGVDVPKVFRLFQRAVKEMPGWEVCREVWLAQFSFNKFLLWKDLTDRVDHLTENRVVDHLVNRPGEPFLDRVESVREDELDDLLRCNEVFCPVSADSSQLAAIVAASKGKNFVLHGPPGTGKSQTITNLIAHCLALGKRVLFVAEKRAALEVVHRRLTRIGLGPFCLELHSNKSGKADVLRQFGEALDFAGRHSPAEWQHLAKKLEATRNELNAYARELHRRYPNGMSAYHCYSWLIARADDPPLPEGLEPLHIDAIENQTRDDFENVQQTCDDLQIRGSESRLSPEARDALRPVGATEWTPDWEDEAVACAKDLQQRCDETRAALAKAAEGLRVDMEAAPRRRIDDYVQLCHRLIDAPGLPATFVEAGEWRAFRQRAGDWIATGRRRDAARDAVAGFDLNAVLALDASGLKRKHDLLVANAGFLSGVRVWFLLKPVRAARAEGQPKWKSDAAPAFFAAAIELQADQRALDGAKAEATERFGAFWADGEADWDRLEKILEFGDSIHALILNLSGEDPNRLIEIRGNVGRLLSVASDMLAPGKPLAETFQTLHEKWESLCKAEESLRTVLKISCTASSFRKTWRGGILPPTAAGSRRSQTPDSCSSEILGGRMPPLPSQSECAPGDRMPPLPAQSECSAGHLAQLIGLAGAVRRFRKVLQNWCRWQEAVQRADAAQLGPLLEAVDGGILPLEEFRSTFELAYREQFLRRLITISETLRNFWGDEHLKKIETFNDLDERYTNLTAQVVASRLAGELPAARTEDCPRNTELGILQRERAKRARHKPVRRLLNEIPTIVPKLKPCFLMSPLSVAQYLDVAQENFDIVVFDEASQIPVWDAVGAIARGKQTIIVGDPKQLPPTNFFGRVESDEDAIDDGSIIDLESILDECLGSGLKTYYLRWHYRSRREGLIAFSNRHYYENQLQTFPSPHAGNVGIRLVPVPDGWYDKGKSRTNPAEAEAIRAEVVRRLTDPETAGESIGIVTFSQAQQELVMDKLDEARREHPEIEEHFGEDAREPVFVKNLENVQGDERDVILFSICYGPDQAGRLSMNFGPLNRKGGERRLNVAITRAKREIVVFSTLRSEQIDLSRTRAIGAEHLKAYLEYAERGPRALAGAIEHAGPEEHDSGFETQVADFLRSRGHDVHSQIGCSGYRIDLAVVAPGAPGHYVLGIECDGASYRRAATARDRDRLRHSVLRGLGWRVHRIWSTDWWRNRNQAETDLLEIVEESIAAFQNSDDPAPVSRNGDPEPASGNDDLPPESGAGEIPTAPPDTPNPAGAPPGAAVRTAREVDYPAVTIVRQPSQETFYSVQGRSVIKNQIRRVIAEEGPIVESLLLRRIIEEWQFTRTGPRIREILESCLPAPLAKTAQKGVSVYWPAELVPQDFDGYRIPTGEPTSKRRAEEIPIEEIRNATLDILERYISYPREDLPREVAKKFGINRLTPNTSPLFEEAIERLLAEHNVTVENGTIKLL